MTTDEEWVGVQDAARASGVATRTLYSWIKGKRLTSKKIAGLQHVTLADVHAAAARLQTPVGASARATQQPAVAASASTAVARARDELEVTRIETEHLKTQAARLRAKDDLALLEAERDKRRQLTEIELERQRLALRREEADHERSIADMAAREEAESRRRAADADNVRLKREREQAARSAAHRRERWLRDWVKRATDWAVAEGLPEIAGPMLPIVRAALQELGPDDPPNVAEDVIYHSLVQAFPTEVARHQEALLRQARTYAAQSAAQAARGESASVQRAVYTAARTAADEVDPQTPDGWNFIEETARLELRRLQAEILEMDRQEAARRRRLEQDAWQARQSAERDAEQLRRQADQKREKDRIARAWADIEAEIPDLARDALPRGSSAAELAAAEAEIQRAVDEKSDTSSPISFGSSVCSLLAPLARQVRERLRAEAEDELWRQAVSHTLAELNRRLPSEVTDSERMVANNDVAMNLSALQGRSSAASAQSAVSDIVAKALLPVQRRLAVKRAVTRVPQSARETVAIAAVRAAAEAVQGRSEAWRLEGLATDAVCRVLDRADRQ